MNIDWFTFTAQIINFAVLIYLLNRFLYGPITRAMNKREDAIASRLQSAEQQQQEAAAAESRFLQLSETLEHQRSDLLEKARADSELTRKSLISDARNEIQSRRDDWLHSLHREQNTLINLVRQRASQQVVAVSRSALSQLADVELEAQTMAMFLKQLDQLPPDQVEGLRQEAAKGDPIQVRTAFEAEDSWQKKIGDTLRQKFGFVKVAFVTVEELICGVELHVGGSKIGWSMQEYLESLTDELQGMLVKEN